MNSCSSIDKIGHMAEHNSTEPVLTPLSLSTHAFPFIHVTQALSTLKHTLSNNIHSIAHLLRKHHKRRIQRNWQKEMADNNRTQRIYRYETHDPPLPRQHRRSAIITPVPVIYRRIWSALSVQRAMSKWLAQKYSNGGRGGSRVELGRSVVRISGGCCRLVTRKIENYNGVTLGVFSLHLK